MKYSFLLVLLVIGGCARLEPSVPAMDSDTPGLEVVLLDQKGEQTGTALFKEDEKGVSFQLHLAGMPPGEKAMHLHDVGVCTFPSFESAGPHWNPQGKQHGYDNPEGYHAGDLPNIMIEEDGSAMVEVTVPGATLQKDKPLSLADVNGTSLVLHEGPDDYKTDPSGNSGKRIACGVVMRPQ